ncbi:hypothetical protein T4D_8087 [Trichinella pseudospiralis]|uniref:PiggyBac transposable element-derived protein 4 C-terminal zinc-ribbon domain-containing protein n=1 Tax=Trichinella pseudospiralis TaxID=6337 RepID=A0A0V1FNA4_TRIPS|nr:hypothetical protein T4D_8087 [Trichinella pseudospiralis]
MSNAAYKSTKTDSNTQLGRTIDDQWYCSSICSRSDCECLIWTAKLPEWNRKRSYHRRIFLLECCRNLTEQKYGISAPCSLSKHTKTSLEALWGPAQETRPQAKMRCAFCSQRRDRKVEQCCEVCQASCCTQHVHKIHPNGYHKLPSTSTYRSFEIQ